MTFLPLHSLQRLLEQQGEALAAVEAETTELAASPDAELAASSQHAAGGRIIYKESLSLRGRSLYATAQSHATSPVLAYHDGSLSPCA